MTQLKTLFAIALMFGVTISKAQTTAMNFNKKDCNGTTHNLFNDLDAGNAVLLHFFMPSCGSCPPPAQKIQAMANHILASHPGKIKAYAIPFNNSTTCSYTSGWVSSNSLSLYTPLDSGAAQVAYYGGFGMPTVVLLGGTDHKVLFSTLSFSTSDTTTMRDKILALFSSMSIADIEKSVADVSVYPNPANDKVQVKLNVTQSSPVKIEVMNLLGEVISNVYDSNTAQGILEQEIATSALNNGVYIVRVSSQGGSSSYKFTVSH